jgi:alpha-galactosidase
MEAQKKVFLLLICSLAWIGVNAQKFENLAQTPPMGWNSWNKFQCNVDENMIRGAADAMVSSGMKDAGYQYIVIDDCWQVSRDSLGFIVADPQRFPSGIKALADYVHSKGLKFGIYSCAGNKTCAGRPAGRGHEYQDALMYAKWGVDYLKYDWCNTEKLNAEGAYMTMRDALYAAGRPIVFSLCEWGDNKPWLWGANIGHLWRTTGDISNCFDCVTTENWQHTVLNILDLQAGLRKYAGPGHWNDPDMLEVGNGMPVNEDRAHFTLWCMLAAPLIAGNDLHSMSPETKSILTNTEVIAIDQDPLGIQGFKQNIKDSQKGFIRFDISGMRGVNKDSLEVWLKPLVNDQWALCVLNRGKTDKSFSLDWKTFSVTDSLSNRTLNTATASYKIRDLWQHKDLGETDKPLKVVVPTHDVLCLKLAKK